MDYHAGYKEHLLLVCLFRISHVLLVNLLYFYAYIGNKDNLTQTCAKLRLRGLLRDLYISSVEHLAVFARHATLIVIFIG